MTERLFLLDAYALIFRAYYAFIRSPRIDSTGRDTGAVFGFALTLLDILEKESPEHIAVVFDPPGGSFRHREYAEYKAQREETPEGIRIAVPLIKEILAAFRIPAVEVPDFEADDTIGTLAKQAEEQGLAVRMVTPDKDFGQLVSERIKIYRPKSGGGYETWGPAEVCEKFGLSIPGQMIDYLGLVGDSSDNIPGCKGIGAKTAEKLLAEYGSIDGIYAHQDELKGAVAKKIQEGEEQTRFSRYLATIRTDAPIVFDSEAYRRTSPDMAAVRECFAALEFRTLLKRLESTPTDAPATDLFAGMVQAQEPPTDLFGEGTDATGLPLKKLTDVPHEYTILKTEEEIADCIRMFSATPCFSFDTETDSKDALRANIVAITLCAESGRAFFIPLPEDEEIGKRRLDLLRPLFADTAIGKVGQNMKYDIQVLSRYGIEVRGQLFDTMIAHYLLFPDLRHNMDEMAETLLGYCTIHYSDLVGSDKQEVHIRQVPLQNLADYAMEDADITWQLYERLNAMLSEAGMTSLFESIEMPLVPVLADMERSGVKLDTEVLRRTASGLSEEMQRIKDEIYRLAGHSFNINSPSQVGTVLFEELQITEKPKKTKSGSYSTNEEILVKLQEKHPIVRLILDYRGIKKLLSTYVEALPEMRYPDGKLHTSFNQTVATTGRLSSSNPNLQNIPIRTEVGRGLRAAFVPDNDECIFMSADYSQIELRLMAHLSEDESLIQAFLHGEDIHRATASKIYRLPLVEVTDDMRRRAKTANFGIIYGISAFGLSERLNISRTEAKALIEGYFASYPGVKAYMDRSIAEAKRQGYVTTLFGRKRFLRDINSANAVVRGYAERNAINAPIQGSAADLIKLAMIRIHEEINERKLRSRMILQVHDELNFNVLRPEAAEVRELVRSCMEGVMPSLRVPLIAEIGEGANWLEAH